MDLLSIGELLHWTKGEKIMYDLIIIGSGPAKVISYSLW